MLELHRIRNNLLTDKTFCSSADGMTWLGALYLFILNYSHLHLVGISWYGDQILMSKGKSRPKANFVLRQTLSKGKFHRKINSVLRQILSEGNFCLNANSVLMQILFESQFRPKKVFVWRKILPKEKFCPKTYYVWRHFPSEGKFRPTAINKQVLPRTSHISVQKQISVQNKSMILLANNILVPWQILS